MGKDLSGEKLENHPHFPELETIYPHQLAKGILHRWNLRRTMAMASLASATLSTRAAAK